MSRIKKIESICKANFNANFPFRGMAVVGVLIALMLLAFSSCEREDDIDEIFIGKTWYMNGGTINGSRMNSAIKNFFIEGQPSAYSITFSHGTFTGLFLPNAPFAGTWTVDGHNHHITLRFNNKPVVSSDFDQQIYNVLKGVRTYESGSSFLILNQDKDNSIMFGNTR